MKLEGTAEAIAIPSIYSRKTNFCVLPHHPAPLGHPSEGGEWLRVQIDDIGKAVDFLAFYLILQTHP